MQLQIYATVFCEKVHAVVFFKVVQQLTVGKVGNSNVLAVPARRAGRKVASPRHADTRLRPARLCRDTQTRAHERVHVPTTIIIIIIIIIKRILFTCR